MIRLIVLSAFLVIPLWLSVVAGVYPVWVFGSFLIGIVGTWVIFLVHELGHVVVGRREGLPLRWVAVGPLMIDATKGGRIRRSPFGAGIGGAAVFDLGGLTDEEVGRALCRMSAGGPVGSFLLAVVCLALSIVIAEPSPYLASTLQFLGGFSLLLGIINAIPMRAGMMRSDGATYLTLMRGGEAAASVVRAARLIEPGQSPVRPAEWPAKTVGLMRETLFRPTPPEPATLDEWLASAQLLYWHELDCGRVDAAYGVLRHVAVVPRDAKAVKKQRYALVDLLTAFHLALWEGSGDTAAGIVAHLPKRSFVRRTPLWIATDGAIKMARGDVRGALKAVSRARKRLAPHATLVGMLGVEQRCYDNLIARAEAAMARTNQLALPPVIGIAPAPPPPVFAVAETAVSTAAIAPNPLAWAVPQTTLWLGRESAAGRSIGETDRPLPIPPPVIVNHNTESGSRERGGTPRPSSRPVAFLQAVSATAVLLIAMVLSVSAYGWLLTAILGAEERERVIAGHMMWATVFAIQLKIAIWIWRNAGAVWGIATLFPPLLLLPVYLYKQYRGKVKRASGGPVRRFRPMATAGAMIAVGILFVGLVVAIGLVRPATDSSLEGNRSSLVR